MHAEKRIVFNNLNIKEEVKKGLKGKPNPQKQNRNDWAGIGYSQYNNEYLR